MAGPNDDEDPGRGTAHLDMATRDRVQRGGDPAAAAAAAGRQFGNVARVQELTREAWRRTWAERLAQASATRFDSSSAPPAYSSNAILPLGRGIRVNTAIFQVINALRLRALPVPHGIGTGRDHGRLDGRRAAILRAGGHAPGRGSCEPGEVDDGRWIFAPADILRIGGDANAVAPAAARSGVARRRRAAARRHCAARDLSARHRVANRSDRRVARRMGRLADLRRDYAAPRCPSCSRPGHRPVPQVSQTQSNRRGSNTVSARVTGPPAMHGHGVGDKGSSHAST